MSQYFSRFGVERVERVGVDPGDKNATAGDHRRGELAAQVRRSPLCRICRNGCRRGSTASHIAAIRGPRDGVRNSADSTVDWRCILRFFQQGLIGRITLQAIIRDRRHGAIGRFGASAQELLNVL